MPKNQDSDRVLKTRDWFESTRSPCLHRKSCAVSCCALRAFGLEGWIFIYFKILTLRFPNSFCSCCLELSHYIKRGTRLNYLLIRSIVSFHTQIYSSGYHRLSETRVDLPFLKFRIFLQCFLQSVQLRRKLPGATFLGRVSLWKRQELYPSPFDVGKYLQLQVFEKYMLIQFSSMECHGMSKQHIP